MAGFALALEIGGTKLQVALGARDGCIEKRVRGKAPADSSADRVMAWFEDHVPSLIQSAQHDGKSITGIGIARRSLGCIRWNAQGLLWQTGRACDGSYSACTLFVNADGKVIETSRGDSVMKQKFLMMVIAVAASLGQTAALAAEYKVDPVNSFAFYKVKHLGVSYAYGQFTAMEGTISFDPSNADANSVEISIKTDSVSTHNSTRDRHLSGPDFFNAKEFPVMKFKSSSWKKAGDNTYTVSGDLTIAGVTKTVTSTVEHVGDGKNPRGQALSGFHAVFSIDRTEFGMNYGVVPGGGGLGKDIDITISIQAVKQ